jgi:hypothetical protein
MRAERIGRCCSAHTITNSRIRVRDVCKLLVAEEIMPRRVLTEEGSRACRIDKGMSTIGILCKG